MRVLDLSRLFMSVGLPMVIFPFTFWLQVQLGYEVSLFPLYMLPIAALSWSFGLPGAFFSVLLATGLWYWGNVLTGYNYVYDWARYYNTGARGAVFLMVAVFIILFKRVVEQHRRRMEAMRALLNVCHGCGSVQGSDGKWIPFDELVVSKTRPICECSECARIAQDGRTGGGGGVREQAAAPVASDAPVETRRASTSWKPGDEDRRQRIRREEDR